ncbi:GNAT family N-acetyltransferase [Halorientalis salina]|uniref:GNAT family N-acetyltransferase n=1 Tax=Halorientalis salina TaxID=2932266 RepID=UPI0010AD0341|nr:GNAT family N-acetyltransferase [Halorientalis salina]
MQFDGLDFPPEPATERWLRETNAREDVEITVPLAVKEDGVPWIISAMILGDDAISIFYHDFQSWNLFTEYDFKNDFSVYSEDLLEPSVGLINEDARVVEQLASVLGDKLLDITGMAFIPYGNPPMAEKIKSAQQNCDCSSIGESQVKAGPGLSTIDDERVYMCTNCSRLHGIEYERSPIRKEKALDANWVLDGETADNFIDTARQSDYLLYSDGERVGKIEHVVAFMGMIGGSVSHSFSNYNPDQQKALVYVTDDSIAGYLTWATESDGHPSLQQLFTRKSFRKQGIASTIINAWVQNFCDHDFFYVEELNDKSRSLFKKLGYFEGQPEAVEHYLLRGVANDWQDGMDKADSVTDFQNAL